MKSIVIIFPYFGILPPQYKMWRESALQNPNIDFMFFTDANVEPATPTNFVNTSRLMVISYRTILRAMTFGDLVTLILYMETSAHLLQKRC